MRFVKATTQEKEAYSGLYPLSHWVTVSGQRCPVEFLNEHNGPKYEVMAPNGFHFVEGCYSNCAGSLHSMLAYSLADAKERCMGTELKECYDDIDHSNSVLD